jgi:multicomponent Na+:H+ antiporter subunit C
MSLLSAFPFYALLAMALFCLGIYGFLFTANLIRKIIALNIMGGSVFLLLMSIAYRNQNQSPDPVPQAMVLTGIVVAVSATALALALARRIHAETGATTLPEEAERE